MSCLFEYVDRATDHQYIAIGSDPKFSAFKAYLEHLWQGYSLYADKNFRFEMAKNFHRRYWEMYLACTLLDLGFQLVPKVKKKGPDIQVIFEGKKIWIEATVPGRGDTIDAVPMPRESLSINAFPEDRIIMRYTNAIDSKNKALKAYIEGGIVAGEDAYVVAINGALIPFAGQESGIPIIVKSVFPIDLCSTANYKESINGIIEPRVGETLIARPEIQKANNASVSTGAFCGPAFSGISGVIFSTANLSVLPPASPSDFIFVHNYVATTPLRKGWLSVGREFWREENELRWRDLTQ